jgi:phosphoadenosine phosphosulfate reductase
MVREIISDQFGQGTGELVLPEDNEVVLLNKAPDVDRLDEVIVNGEVYGALKFDIKARKFKFLARPRVAEVISPKLTKGNVIIDKGAVQPVLNSANVLAPGVLDADDRIQPGNEVIVMDEAQTPIAIGSAKMGGREMVDSSRGLAVKVRWTVDQDELDKFKPEDRNNSWAEVIEANQKLLTKKTSEAVDFIKRTVIKIQKPAVVSYSGGKDSLATLLLVLDAGISPQLLFIDTGLEFPETVEHVQDLANEYKLDLIVESANSAFWDAVNFFGPPGKDFRWCCKTCKLGPATRVIKNNFEDGVLAFIGQRKYESMARSKSKRVWDNPWVPGQIGASPIQNWSALHVWLYLFQKNVDFNIWYKRGLERIGCYLCPATDLGDLVIVSKLFPDYERWERFLSKYAEEKGFTNDWSKYGLWRWKRTPRSMQNLITELDLTIRSETPSKDVESSSASGIINYYTSGTGYIPCDEGGLSLEGVFDRKLDIDKVSNILNILGEVNIDKTTDSCSVRGIVDVYGEGAVVGKGKTE